MNYIPSSFLLDLLLLVLEAAALHPQAAGPYHLAFLNILPLLKKKIFSALILLFSSPYMDWVECNENFY